jgi:four helix bundle protein
MRESILKTKSFEFGVTIVLFCRQFRKEKKEYVISDQLLRSGTAVGALIREAEYGQSRADFIHKMNIALKEAAETDYWLDIMKASGYLDDNTYQKLSPPAKEILRMLIATVNTAKRNNQ